MQDLHDDAHGACAQPAEAMQTSEPLLPGAPPAPAQPCRTPQQQQEQDGKPASQPQELSRKQQRKLEKDQRRAARKQAAAENAGQPAVGPVQPQQLPHASLTVEEADMPISPSDYVVVGGLRLVRPYHFDFKCHVKKRWEGKTLVDLFAEEFPLLTRAYYSRAFEAGRLRVELSSVHGGRLPPITLSTHLTTGMCVRHLIHRHEPPVLAGPVEVLGETADFVAVNKPACMPVHTVGQYRKNTVLGVLQAEHPELGHLHPTYRLDKPVSGLLLLARSPAAATTVRKHLEGRTCQKVYVARVAGRFPSGPDDPATGALPAGATWLNTAAESAADGSHGVQEEGKGENHEAGGPLGGGGGSSAAGASAIKPGVSGGEAGCGHGGAPSSHGHVVAVDVALTWDAKTNHACAVPPGAPNPTSSTGEALEPKQAITHFRLLWVAPDGATSVIEARPKTGRTHQIRVHLQYLGYPIANDTQYGGTAYGAPLAFRRLHGHAAATAGTAATAATARSDTATLAPPVPGASAGVNDQAVQALQGEGGSTNGADPNGGALQGDGAGAAEPECKRQRCSSPDTHAAFITAFQPSVVEQSHAAGSTGQPATSQPGAGGGVPAAGHQPLSRAQLMLERSRMLSIDDGLAAAAAVVAAAGSSAEARDLTAGGQNGSECQGAAGACSGSSQGKSEGGSLTGWGSLPSHIRELYLDPRFRVPEEQEEQVCPHCPCLVPRGYPIDIQPLWLHARRYSSKDWAFEAPMPAWADDQYVPQPHSG